MKPFRIKHSKTEAYDVYDIIELYKAKIITKEEARVLFFSLVKDWLPND